MTNNNQALHEDNYETYFLSLSKDDVLRLLTLIAFALNAAIDSGVHQDLTPDRIANEINNGTIFQLLAEFPELKELACGELYVEVRERLVAEWQSINDGSIPERKYGVTRNALSLFLAYVIESIQMRTLGDEPWPGP